MKRFLALLVVSILFVSNSYSQNPYNLYGPENDRGIKPETFYPRFSYDPEVMKDFTFKSSTFKNDQVISTETINMSSSTAEELESYNIVNIKNQNSKPNNSSSILTSIKRSDTVSYQPAKDEIIYRHSKSQELYPSPMQLESIDELVFLNDGRIIATQDQNAFIKYSYDFHGNIIQVISYQSTLSYNEMNPNGVPVFMLSPLTYIEIQYDSSNKMTDKWLFNNQELYFPNENKDYNESLTVHHETYQYNNRDLLKQSSLTTFFIKDLKEDDPNKTELDDLINNPETIDFTKLLNFLHSKEIYTKNYTYNASNKLTNLSVHKEMWSCKNDQLNKINDVNIFDLTIKYDGNKTIVDEITTLEDNKNKKQNIRTVYLLDHNSFLKEKTSYNNSDTKNAFTLETKETMNITYK